MADCAPFRVFVGQEIDAVVAKLRDEMKQRGIQASARGASEVFRVPVPMGGTIQGHYAIRGESLIVTIESRPESLSCGNIESKIMDLILDAKAALRSRSKLGPAPDTQTE